MIRALVFDFDGLIVDTESPIIHAWVSLHEDARIPFRREDAFQVVGHVDMDYDPWTAFDASVDRDGLEREHKKRSRAMLAQQPILPGVVDYLAEARRRGIQTAIASNSSHQWVETHLARLGLAGHFDRVRCREDVARGKPEPDLYRLVLNDFGLAGSEAVAFEDSHAGSLAAKRAGLWCVAVPNPCTLHHSFDHVDLKLSRLGDLPLAELLGRLAGQPRADCC